MSEYSNENSGALFKNDKKEQENHSDYNGTLNAGGTEYWINGWIKKSKAGKSYMSLSVKQKNHPAAPVDDGFDSEVPF